LLNMAMNGGEIKFYCQVPSRPRKQPTVWSVLKADWAPGPVWTQWRNTYFNLSRIELCIVTYQTGRLVTIVTELYVSFYIIRIDSDYFNLCGFKYYSLEFQDVILLSKYFLSPPTDALYICLDVH
jgi:hypothetical protein